MERIRFKSRDQMPGRALQNFVVSPAYACKCYHARLAAEILTDRTDALA
jgi:hypothetical protein